jgi:hypothetical protein
MPAQTANGLPYPLSTEPVADGAEAIQALATAISAARLPYGLKSGAVTVELVAASAATAAVTWSAMGATPRVAVNITSGTSRLVTARAQAASPTGFTAWVGVASLDQTLTTRVTLTWTAIQTTGPAAADPAAAGALAEEGTMAVGLTCQHEGCPAQGELVTLEVPDGSNPDVPAPSSYWCGVCGTQITEVEVPA